MSYSDFDLKTAVQVFGLSEDDRTDLFASTEAVEPSDTLISWLREFAPVAVGFNTEKARSEFIIAPLLAEAKRRAGTEVNVLSGAFLDVDRERGLTGTCDFLIARSPEFYYVQAPVLAVVEAKRENLGEALGQCVAEMVAIQLFNEREGSPLPAVHGCVTSGNIWRFLRLREKRVFVDLAEYHLRDVAKILGILVSITRG